ncbi:MAG: PAS domain S-box protein [Desulfobacterales bacterium]
MKKSNNQHIELLKEKEKLLEEIESLSRAKKINEVLFRISNAVTTSSDLDQLYSSIHRSMSKIVNVSSFYIAMHDKESDSIIFPYYTDDEDSDQIQYEALKSYTPVILDILETGRSLMLTKKDFFKQFQESSQKISCRLPEIWIGIPLKIQNEVIGIMAAQSYTNPDQYDKTDINLLHSVSNQVAIAIERKKAEESLRASEKRLTMALEATSDSIWDWRLDRKSLYLDPRLFNVLGYEENEFSNIYDQWIRLVHPDDLKSVENTILDHIKGKTDTFKSEFRVKTKNGSWIWILARGKVVQKSSQNKAVRMIGTYTDITSQKDALKAMEESEERFRTLLKASFGGIGIHEKGLILDANHGLTALTGYEHDELIGMNGLLLIAEKWRDMVMEKIVTGYDKPYDAEGLRKDGSIYPLEIKGKAIPYHGRTVRVTEFRDITERKNVEDALKESDERHRILSEVTMEGIIFHENGMAIDINNSFSRMFDYRHSEIIGTNFVEQLVAPEDKEKVYQNIEARGELPFEIMMIKKDGTIFPVEIEARNVEYKKKFIRVASVRDISDRKRTEERLIQLQKMEAIGTLAGGIAHDFNNLLGGILGNVGLLKINIPDENPAFKKILTIEKIVQRGANLARQLLGFARGGKYQITPINPNLLVQETLEMYGRTSKNIQLHTDFQKDVWIIEGDRNQIEQVVLNLFINAADSMPEGGSIYIDTKNTFLSEIAAKQHMGEPGNYVTITVRDTGHGMDKETRAKIFDPFFTTKEPSKGTGLGLSSAYGIIKNHNGHIDVYSEPGKGSIFKVFLPVSEKETTVQKGAVYKFLEGDETVLLVDDEYDFRDAGEEMLRVMGYKVITAKNGKQAVEIFSSMPDKIDLVILDMIMPVMGGGETFDHLKKIRSDIKVMLSSGYSTDSEASEILARGCNSFIQKPFGMIELSQKLRETLDEKK